MSAEYYFWFGMVLALVAFAAGSVGLVRTFLFFLCCSAIMLGGIIIIGVTS